MVIIKDPNGRKIWKLRKHPVYGRLCHRCLTAWVVPGLVIVEDDSPNQAVTQCWEVEPRDS